LYCCFNGHQPYIIGVGDRKFEKQINGYLDHIIFYFFIAGTIPDCLDLVGELANGWFLFYTVWE